MIFIPDIYLTHLSYFLIFNFNVYSFLKENTRTASTCDPLNFIRNIQDIDIYRIYNSFHNLKFAYNIEFKCLNKDSKKARSAKGLCLPILNKDFGTLWKQLASRTIEKPQIHFMFFGEPMPITKIIM